MASLWISVVLLLLAKNAASEYNPEVCLILEESFGLIPPPLPTNFEMETESIDHIQKTSAYEELYFDYTNSRVKFMKLVNTTEYHYLFDYETQQVVEWMKLHPGVSMKRDPLSLVCTANDMDDSPIAKYFGYEDLQVGRTKMFNSNQMLRYGSQYLFAANGSHTLRDRNLPTNRFIGCVYDQTTTATMFNEFYFIDTNFVEPSGGTPSSLLNSSPDDKPLSVPARIRVTGQYDVGETTYRFDRTFSISWFKGKPEFHYETFRIPPWVNCKDYRGRKIMNNIPVAFSTRLLVTRNKVDSLGNLVVAESVTSYEEIYYDNPRKLARRDYTPDVHLDTEMFSRFGSYSPVSTIYDFNEGIMFGIHKASGRCFIRPILENEYFDTRRAIVYRKLADPEELFHMEMDEMEYKGKYYARDVMCDVWNGKHYDEQYNVSLIKETYFSTEGWHELADEMTEYSVPVRHMLIQDGVDGNLEQSVSTINFLKFKGKQPVVSSFNIKNCIEQIDHKRFAIQLLNNADYTDKVFKYKFNFLEAAQIYITKETGVNTPLRVQRLHIRHLSGSNPVPFLVFSLLEKANLKNLPLVVSQKGKDLKDAIILLQKLVESGKFIIQFKDPQEDEEIISVPAGVPTLYTLTEDGGFTQAQKFADTDDAASSESNVVYEDHKGMTDGILTLLAFSMLLLGVGIGVLIMYAYFRIYKGRTVDEGIDMKYASSSGP